MKNNKNLYAGIAHNLWALTTVMLFACTEDSNVPETLRTGEPTDAICFGISNNESRTANDDGTEQRGGSFVLRGTDCADSLFVSTTVTPGIGSSCVGGEGRIGRAAPKDGTDMYESFQVIANVTKDGTSQEFFNQTATIDNGVYKTATTYYWPGSDYTLDFYAYAPTDWAIDGTYTVNTDVAKQSDLLVARDNSNITGAYNGAYPLNFEHVCTAVTFKVGSQMQNGTIKSITLKNIKNKGTFDQESNSWTVDADSKSDYTLTPDFATATTTTSGTAITSGENTFIMLPQTLAEDATLEVVFNDGTDHTLTCSLSGEWKQNTTVSYLISIEPFYDLKFVTEQEDIPVKDCHYVWEALKISTDGKYTGKWALTTNQDWATIRLLPEHNESDLDLYYQGYWCIDDRGEQTLTGNSITTDGIDVLVYLYENTNATNNDTREVTVTLNAINDNGDYIPIATRTISQYEPIWNGGKAYERIEEYDANTTFPWGFNWTNTTVKFTGTRSYLRGIVFKLLQTVFGYGDNVKMSWDGATATISMSDIKALGTTASDADNGLQNTKDLLNFDGIDDLNTSVSLLEGWGMTLDESSMTTQPTNYAVRMILYKNKFNRNTETQAGNTINVAKLTKDGVEWYLPAPGEVGTLQSTAADNDANNNDTPLYTDDETGYWSSQAEANSNTNSYYYTSGGKVDESVARSNQKRVRAARIKP